METIIKNDMIICDCKLVKLKVCSSFTEGGDGTGRFNLYICKSLDPYVTTRRKWTPMQYMQYMHM